MYAHQGSGVGAGVYNVDLGFDVLLLGTHREPFTNYHLPDDLRGAILRLDRLLDPIETQSMRQLSRRHGLSPENDRGAQKHLFLGRRNPAFAC